jgi:hypothetical protein
MPGVEFILFILHQEKYAVDNGLDSHTNLMIIEFNRLKIIKALTEESKLAEIARDAHGFCCELRSI